MSSTYPIVKIDRTTITEILPIFINKGIFSNYDDLPERADLLNKLKENLNVVDLSFEQEREHLTQVGEYKTKKYVVRDYGNYIIAFSLNAYQGNLNDDLPRVRLNKLGHKIAMIILSEVYHQRKWEGLVIPKQKIVECLESSIKKGKTYQDKMRTFLSRIQSNYDIVKPSKKLQEFYNHDFKTFLTELKKKKITLSLIQQDEW
jgi:hypothetical protein